MHVQSVVWKGLPLGGYTMGKVSLIFPVTIQIVENLEGIMPQTKDVVCSVGTNFTSNIQYVFHLKRNSSGRFKFICIVVAQILCPMDFTYALNAASGFPMNGGSIFSPCILLKICLNL